MHYFFQFQIQVLQTICTEYIPIHFFQHLSTSTAIPRLLRTSLIALSLIAHQQMLTIPHFLRSLFSLFAHFALQNWCNLIIFG